MSEPIEDVNSVPQPEFWRVVGVVLFAVCLLSIAAGIATQLRFVTNPFPGSTHRRLQAIAEGVGLLSALVLLAAVLALRSASQWSRHDRIVYRTAGALGAVIAAVALYGAIDAPNAISGAHGVPALDRLARAAGGLSAAVVGVMVVWLVFRASRSRYEHQ